MGFRGDEDRRVGSELSNLVFPKVPDISLHHKLVLPPNQWQSVRGDYRIKLITYRNDGGME